MKTLGCTDNSPKGAAKVHRKLHNSSPERILLDFLRSVRTQFFLTEGVFSDCSGSILMLSSSFSTVNTLSCLPFEIAFITQK